MRTTPGTLTAITLHQSLQPRNLSNREFSTTTQPQRQRHLNYPPRLPISTTHLNYPSQQRQKIVAMPQ